MAVHFLKYIINISKAYRKDQTLFVVLARPWLQKMPRGRPKNHHEMVTKKEQHFTHSNVSYSNMNMSRISGFDDNATYPNFTEFEMDDTDFDEQISQEMGLIPRRQIKFHDYSDDVIQLKSQEQKYNVEQIEEDELFYVTPTKKSMNSGNVKIIDQNANKISQLIFQKLVHNYKANNPIFGKASYRIKRQSQLNSMMVSSTVNEGQDRQFLHIND